MVEDVVADVVEGMVELFAVEEGTLEDWIEEIPEMMVGEAEGEEGVVDVIELSCTVTDDQRWYLVHMLPPYPSLFSPLPFLVPLFFSSYLVRGCRSSQGEIMGDSRLLSAVPTSDQHQEAQSLVLSVWESEKEDNKQEVFRWKKWK